MQLEDAVINRRSVRKYLPEPVDNGQIIQLLGTAIWAPTACNKQNYFFIIVEDKKLIAEIVDAGATKFLLNNDKLLFILYSSLTDNLEYSDHIQSASAIIQNFLLLSHEKNIGTCWVCHLPRKRKLQQLLNIPPNIEVIAAVSLGHANLENVKRVERKHEIRDVVGINTFYAKNIDLGNSNRIYTKAVLKKIYYLLFPTAAKKFINNFLDKHFVKKFKN